MSKQVLIAALRQGNTAREILDILDVITSTSVNDSESSAYAVPTLTEIDF